MMKRCCIKELSLLLKFLIIKFRLFFFFFVFNSIYLIYSNSEFTSIIHLNNLCSKEIDLMRDFCFSATHVSENPFRGFIHLSYWYIYAAESLLLVILCNPFISLDTDADFKKHRKEHTGFLCEIFPLVADREISPY